MYLIYIEDSKMKYTLLEGRKDTIILILNTKIQYTLYLHTSYPNSEITSSAVIKEKTQCPHRKALEVWEIVRFAISWTPCPPGALLINDLFGHRSNTRVHFDMRSRTAGPKNSKSGPQKVTISANSGNSGKWSILGIFWDRRWPPAGQNIPTQRYL